MIIEGPVRCARWRPSVAVPRMARMVGSALSMLIVLIGFHKDMMSEVISATPLPPSRPRAPNRAHVIESQTFH